MITMLEFDLQSHCLFLLLYPFVPYGQLYGLLGFMGMLCTSVDLKMVKKLPSKLHKKTKG